MAGKFPQYLHKPYRLLWFEIDEVYLMIGGYIFAMLFTMKLLLALPVVVFLYRREKKKRPRGFIKQIAYLLGIVSFSGYPTYFVRRFTE